MQNDSDHVLVNLEAWMRRVRKVLEHVVMGLSTNEKERLQKHVMMEIPYHEIDVLQHVHLNPHLHLFQGSAVNEPILQ